MFTCSQSQRRVIHRQAGGSRSKLVLFGGHNMANIYTYTMHATVKNSGEIKRQCGNPKARGCFENALRKVGYFTREENQVVVSLIVPTTLRRGK